MRPGEHQSTVSDDDIAFPFVCFSDAERRVRIEGEGWREKGGGLDCFKRRCFNEFTRGKVEERRMAGSEAGTEEEVKR